MHNTIVSTYRLDRRRLIGDRQRYTHRFLFRNLEAANQLRMEPQDDRNSRADAGLEAPTRERRQRGVVRKYSQQSRRRMAAAMNNPPAKAGSGLTDTQTGMRIATNNSQHKSPADRNGQRRSFERSDSDSSYPANHLV